MLRLSGARAASCATSPGMSHRRFRTQLRRSPCICLCLCLYFHLVARPTPATKYLAASNRPENQTKSKNPAGALYGGSGQGGQDRFVGGGHCSAIFISSIQ